MITEVTATKTFYLGKYGTAGIERDSPGHPATNETITRGINAYYEFLLENEENMTPNELDTAIKVLREYVEIAKKHGIDTSRWEGFL